MFSSSKIRRPDTWQDLKCFWTHCLTDQHPRQHRVGPALGGTRLGDNCGCQTIASNPKSPCPEWAPLTIAVGRQPLQSRGFSSDSTKNHGVARRARRALRITSNVEKFEKKRYPQTTST